VGRYPRGCVRMKEWTRALVAEESGSEDEGWCVVDDVCNDVLSTLMSALTHMRTKTMRAHANAHAWLVRQTDTCVMHRHTSRDLLK